MLAYHAEQGSSRQARARRQRPRVRPAARASFRVRAQAFARCVLSIHTTASLVLQARARAWRARGTRRRWPAPAASSCAGVLWVSGRRRVTMHACRAPGGHSTTPQTAMRAQAALRARTPTPASPRTASPASIARPAPGPRQGARFVRSVPRTQTRHRARRRRRTADATRERPVRTGRRARSVQRARLRMPPVPPRAALARRARARRPGAWRARAACARRAGAGPTGGRAQRAWPVSYTHLTLPTNREV